MSLLTLLILAFTLFAASRAVLRWRDKELALSGMLFWLVIWTVVFVVALFPSTSSQLATLTGVGRGVDVAFFGAIVLLFYLIFRLYIKLDHVDRDVTELVIKLAQEKAVKQPPS